jgi:hypothetical protein
MQCSKPFDHLVGAAQQPRTTAIRLLGEVGVAEPSRDQVSLRESKQPVTVHIDRR